MLFFVRAYEKCKYLERVRFRRPRFGTPKTLDRVEGVNVILFTHVAVLGCGRWEPWSDLRATGAEYRSQGKRLVVRQSAGSPFLFRA